jgi:hypothetical protein
MVVHVVVVAVCALLSKPDHAHQQRLKNGEHVNWSLVIMMYDFIKQELRQKQNGPGANRLAAALCTDHLP